MVVVLVARGVAARNQAGPPPAGDLADPSTQGDYAGSRSRTPRPGRAVEDDPVGDAPPVAAQRVLDR